MGTKKRPDNLAQQISEIMFSARAFIDKPLSEQELAERFGVSRTPIRDALTELEGAGLICRQRKRGVYLRRPTRRDIEEVYDLRAAIEGFAVNLAANNARRRDILALDAIAVEFNRVRKESQMEQSKKLNVEFHRMIIRMSENSLIQKTIDGLHLIERAFSLAHSAFSWSKQSDVAYSNTSCSHEKIVDALKSGFPELGEKLMRAHIQNAKERLIEFLEASDATKA